MHDTRALIGKIAGLPAMDAIFTHSGHLQTQVALAADYFGRPGQDWAGRRLRPEHLRHSFLMHPPPAFRYLPRLT